MNLLYDWLRNNKRKWVIVLDNLDDDQLLYETPLQQQEGLVNDRRHMPRRHIWKYFPDTLQGSIIVTSRSKRAALNAVDDIDIIPVEPMDEIYAATLFEKKLGAQATREEVDRLTKALDFMPLAIVQAAVYIKQRSPRVSIVSYEEKFRQNNRQKTRLLHIYERDRRRDLEANHSILTTWQISFDHIQKLRPAAADLLSLMSFFDRQGISESLLREGQKIKRNVERSSTDNIDQLVYISDEDDSASECVMGAFEEDLLVLRDYSLISIGADVTKFEIHQLVQLAIQEWLKAQGKLDDWKDWFILILYSQLSDVTLQNWQGQKLLLAHVQSAITHRPDSRDSLENWASLLYRAAWFAKDRGDYVNCQEIAEIAKVTRMELFGPEDERTLISFEQLAYIYMLRSQLEKAEEFRIHVLETRKKVLGPKHHDTLRGMSNLASLYRLSGLSNEAEALQKQVVDTREEAFDPDDLDTLVSRSFLASVYDWQGRWKEAEKLQKRVVDTHQQVFGLENSNTLSSMVSLASIYRSQGRLKQAEALQLQVLQFRTKVLGQRHHDTRDSMIALSSIYYHQGRWKEAEELELQLLDLDEQTLGPRHSSTLNSMVNLASNYYSQGRWKEAQELSMRIFNIRQEDLGPEHRNTLASMNYRPSNALQVQVLDTRMQGLGPEHPDTLDSMNYQPSVAFQTQLLDTHK